MLKLACKRYIECLSEGMNFMKKHNIFKQLLIVFAAVFSFVLLSAGTTSASTIGDLYGQTITAHMIKPTKMTPNTTTTFDVVLKPQNEQAYYQEAMDVNDPTKSNFKNFLTGPQIQAKYGQPQSVLDQWVSLFKKNHLNAEVYKNGFVINVSGKVKYIDKMFRTNMNTAKYHSDPLQFSSKKPSIPANLKDTVFVILGMADHSKGNFYPDTDVSFDEPVKAPNYANQVSHGYTSRFTDTYGVNDLYKQGLTGKGQTIGIITFGNVVKSNLFHFWKHENASTDKNRFTVRTVKGNTINKGYVTKDDSEATMDTEYAGSVAPQANIKMYYNKAATSDYMNLINSYLMAYDDGDVSAISNSWGLGPNNYFQILEKRKIMPSQYIQVLNLVLAQGALQGVSSFVASGDNGALNYTISGLVGNDAILDRSIQDTDPYPSNPWVTSAGGTSLPFQFKMMVDGHSLGTITNAKERSWGSDYYWPFLMANSNFIASMPEYWDLISDAGGGGFNQAYQTPSYQEGVPGVNTYNAREYLSQYNQPVFNAPLFHGTNWGRNYPDISANADSMTGYQVYQKSHGKAWDNYGGTSVVSPQFAGVTALINSASGRQRMGFWNPQLYQLATKSDSPFHPLNDTDENSNLYYTGQPGTVYNQASGLGTVDFSKLFNVYK